MPEIILLRPYFWLLIIGYILHSVGSSDNRIQGDSGEMLEVKEVANMDWETVDVKTRKLKIDIVKGELAHESVSSLSSLVAYTNVLKGQLYIRDTCL